MPCDITIKSYTIDKCRLSNSTARGLKNHPESRKSVGKSDADTFCLPAGDCRRKNSRRTIFDHISSQTPLPPPQSRTIQFVLPPTAGGWLSFKIFLRFQSSDVQSRCRFSLFLLFHLFEDGYDHVEGRPLARVLVHADPDELGHVARHARGDLQPQALGGDLRRGKLGA